MGSLFRNKAVVVTALFLSLFVGSFTWVAVKKTAVICQQTTETCKISASEGSMIWDEVTLRILQLVSI